MKQWGVLLLLAGAALWPAAAPAQVSYTVQPLVNAGDPIGALQIPALGGEFTVLGLGDTGRLDFFTWTNPDASDPRIALVEESGGQLAPLYREPDPLGSLAAATFDVPAADMNRSGQVVFAVTDAQQKRSFVEYSAGKLTVIATEGGAAPGGRWQSLDSLRPLMLNQRGDVVFQALVAGTDGSIASDLFRWDAGQGQVVRVAGSGTIASDHTAVQSVVPGTAAINDTGQITYAAGGMDASGKLGAGLYLREADGSVRPVALDDQALPDGDRVGSVIASTLDDHGNVAFVALRKSDAAEGVYRWQNGTLSATGIVAGAAAPGGGTFVRVDDVRINPADGGLLIAAELANNPAGLAGLYRASAGPLTAALVPGQSMPGGTINAGPPDGDWQWSPFNAAGQLAVVTQLADGNSAAYLLDAGGKLTLLLKDGMSTPLGPVMQVGSHPVSPHLARFPTGLNSRGQVALRAQLSTGGDALFLLTPP